MLHTWATDRDDPTVQPRWGKIGKQRIEDAGTLYPKRMETVDDEILQNTFAFIDKAKRDNKPFFVWLNPTRMHVVTHLSEKYEKMRNSENGWSISEAGFAQLDDIVGAVMKELKDEGFDDNTIVARVSTSMASRHRSKKPCNRRPDSSAAVTTPLRGLGAALPAPSRSTTVPAAKGAGDCDFNRPWMPRAKSLI
jgi:Sulfatase